MKSQPSVCACMRKNLCISHRYQQWGTWLIINALMIRYVDVDSEYEY
jgi:hypothetical protein